jgi:DNA-binding IclR family transcriptional regulator
MCNHRTVVRPSPQTERVIALIDVLAARPHEALTLAEVTRRLGVNKSTCFSMLQALTEVGWLLRDPFHKTYRLGPALVAVGQAASSGFPALEFARPAMIELSRGVGSHCVALAVAPEHVTVVDQVRDVRAVGAPIGHGYIPLRPPFGAAVAAWSGPAVAQRWLSLAPAGTTERYAKALEVVRRKGYVVELAEPSWTPPTDATSLPEVVEQLALLLPPDVLPLELNATRSYSVSAINAAVVDADGAVVLIVSLMGFPGTLTGADVEAAGDRLSAATSAVTVALAGHQGGIRERIPQPDPPYDDAQTNVSPQEVAP